MKRYSSGVSVCKSSGARERARESRRHTINGILSSIAIVHWSIYWENHQDRHGMVWTENLILSDLNVCYLKHNFWARQFNLLLTFNVTFLWRKKLVYSHCYCPSFDLVAPVNGSNCYPLMIHFQNWTNNQIQLFSHFLPHSFLNVCLFDFFCLQFFVFFSLEFWLQSFTLPRTRSTRATIPEPTESLHF